MGQTMSRPATAKTTEAGGNSKFFYGVSEMQGWRISMEDAHTIALDLDEGQDNSNTFFAVYDGHGGGLAAKYAGANVHKELVVDDTYRGQQYRAALKHAFLTTDSKMRDAPEFNRDGSGCTAVAALVTKEGKIFVANAGDSRSVLSVGGEAKPLSFDHKPQNETEKTRIAAAGGYVSFGRVNGNLALARALGDFDYKKNAELSPEAQIITSDPEITEHEITDDDEFLILACDGIWDCLTSQQAVDVIRLLISQGKQLPEVCEEICELCLAPDTTGGVGIGCDNMTILVVALLHGRSVEEWHQWVTERAKSKYGHNTPDELPQLYSENRMSSYRARRAIWEQRDQDREVSQATEPEKQGPPEYLDDEGRPLGPLARALRDAGIPFVNGAKLDFGSPPLMYDNDDDDSDGDGMPSMPWNVEGDEDDSRFREFGEDHATKSLRAQLDELERDDSPEPNGDAMEEGSAHNYGYGKGSATWQGISSASPHHELQGEAPPPPTPSQDGDAGGKQPESVPGGDAPSPAVKAEGLMDTSESPLKV